MRAFGRIKCSWWSTARVDSTTPRSRRPCGSSGWRPTPGPPGASGPASCLPLRTRPPSGRTSARTTWVCWSCRRPAWRLSCRRRSGLGRGKDGGGRRGLREAIRPPGPCRQRRAPSRRPGTRARRRRWPGGRRWCTDEVVERACCPTPEWFFGFEDFDFFCRVRSVGLDVVLDCASAVERSTATQTFARERTTSWRRIARSTPTNRGGPTTWLGTSSTWPVHTARPGWLGWHLAYSARRLQLASSDAERVATLHGLFDGLRGSPRTASALPQDDRGACADARVGRCRDHSCASRVEGTSDQRRIPLKAG